MKRHLACCALATVTLVTSQVTATASAATCAEGTASTAMDAFFAADDAAGLSGADYPHALALPDGRVLWTFQDAFVGGDANLRDDLFFHNVGVVQAGSCFELLVGEGGSWIGSGVEVPLHHWFWPLDAELGADGHIWVFVAEVTNDRGTGAATGAVPVATWRARVSLPDLRVVDLLPAADPSADLFGYSIVSDDAWSYLYGHCYRQFVPDTAQGFDPSCSPLAYVARVPRGRFELPLEYWTANGWSPDSTAKSPVLSGTGTLPPSVQRFGDGYVVASDEGDWAGPSIIIRTAIQPQGPWQVAATLTPPTKCAACNNYGAFLMPDLEAGRVVIAYSNNAWTMDPDAFDNASLYRISFTSVAVPGVPHISFPPVVVPEHPRWTAWIAVILIPLVAMLGALRLRAEDAGRSRSPRSVPPLAGEPLTEIGGPS